MSKSLRYFVIGFLGLGSFGIVLASLMALQTVYETASKIPWLDVLDFGVFTLFFAFGFYGLCYTFHKAITGDEFE